MEDKKVTIETVEGETIELNVQKEKWYKRAWNKTTKTVKDIAITGFSRGCINV